MLAARQTKFVPPGEIVAVPPCGAPYRAIIHAVAIDAFYATSIELVSDVLARSLALAAEHDARRVALAALATGYGRLPMSDFARAVQSMIDRAFPPIEAVVLGIRSPREVDELREVLPQVIVA